MAETTETVSIDRDTAVAVLTALKFKSPETWDDAKILAKLSTLGNVKGAMDHVAKISDPDVKEAAEAIVENVGNTFEFDAGEEAVATEGEEAEVETEEEAAEDESATEGEVEEEAEEEVEPEEEPEPTPAKKETKVATTPAKAPAKPAAKTTPAKAPAKPAAKTNPKAPPAKAAGKAPAEKPAPKEKKEAVEKDAFGMRLGTRAARLNEAITGEPRTPKEIADAAKYDKSIHNHLKKLVELGHVVLKDGKYSRKGAAPKAKAAAKPAAKVAAKK